MSGVGELVSTGPIPVAVAVAGLAGLVSFLSPCVLPLVPGYLSYVTGLAGADLDAALNRPGAAARGRILAGTAGFVAGFTAVFTAIGVALASLRRVVFAHVRPIEIIAGVLIVLMGLAFLGLIPGLARNWRISALPSAGLAAAPLLGAVFALSWTPCIGPTLGAVLTLAAVGGSTGRAVILTSAYCLGLGLPLVAIGLGFRRLIGLHRVVRRNSAWVTRVGGALLIIVGLALVTGGWGEFLNWLRASIGPGTVPL